jgi:hypothetical protein
VLAVPDTIADAELPPVLALKRPGPTPVAYLCRGSVCSAPLTSLEALAAALRHTDGTQ